MKVSSIAEQLLFSTVRIDTIHKDGREGVGTGFIFSLRREEVAYLFLVTNRHVVKDTVTGFLTFTLKSNDQPALGQKYELEINNFEAPWRPHHDAEIDVAVCPFVPILKDLKSKGVDVFFRKIENLIPSQEILEGLDAIEDCIFIGYPSGIWDEKNNLPIVRRATTATPVNVDFQGKKQFLIDASVFPGSSGSPVFLYNIGSYALKSGGMAVGSRLYFLGVLGSVFFREERGRIELLKTQHIPIPVIKEMVDLGVVYKAETVLETVEEWMAPH